MKTSVSLSDVDLAALMNSADTDVRLAALAAVQRLHAPARWPDIPAHVAALIADVLAEARKNGRLIYRGVAVSSCRYCGALSKYEKSKRRKKTYEAKISGIEFADRFVIITGHISVGGCRSCVDLAAPALRVELATFPVQLPTGMRLEGVPVYQRWDRCRCKKCEWSGHDGQLGKLRTLMNDGWYQGKCPSCGAESKPFGPDPFERIDGFDVVEQAASTKGRM